MKRMLLFPLLILPLLAGCDSGGGGGSPTEPTPRPNANVQGVWTGTASSLSARGTCLADAFVPGTVSVVWTIRQTGSAFTATEVLNNAQVCGFTGTVSGNTATFRPDLAASQAVCSVQNLACTGLRPVRIELSTSRTTMTGVVDGNRMTITSVQVWRAVDSNTGNSLGDFEVTGRQDLQR